MLSCITAHVLLLGIGHLEFYTTQSGSYTRFYRTEITQCASGSGSDRNCIRQDQHPVGFGWNHFVLPNQNSVQVLTLLSNSRFWFATGYAMDPQHGKNRYMTMIPRVRLSLSVEHSAYHAVNSKLEFSLCSASLSSLSLSTIKTKIDFICRLASSLHL